MVQILKDKGITNAAALLGGTDAWKNAGYPMDGTNQTENTSPANSNANKPKK